MKKILLPILVFSLLLVIFTIPTNAENRADSLFLGLKEKLGLVMVEKEKPLIQVGDEIITNKKFNSFKSYMETNRQLNQKSSTLTDQYLWNELITDSLLLQEAKSKKIAVSLEEAKKYSFEMRDLLAKADREAHDFQKKVIAATGLDEEAYWSNYAPKAYQEQLIINKLTQQLINEKQLPKTNNLDEFSKAYGKYIQQLKAKNLGKIKVLDKDLKLDPNRL